MHLNISDPIGCDAHNSQEWIKQHRPFWTAITQIAKLDECKWVKTKTKQTKNNWESETNVRTKHGSFALVGFASASTISTMKKEIVDEKRKTLGLNQLWTENRKETLS